MARYNEILVGRFNRAIQKLTGIKGEVPAPQLSSELMVVLDIPFGREMDPHLGWTRFATGGPLTGAAGQVAQFRFRNPAASRVIAVFESIIVASAAVDEFVISSGTTSTDLATAVTTTNFRLDNRGPANAPVSVVSTTTVAGGGDLAVFRVDVPLLANTNFQVIQGTIQEIPILPGDALHVRNVTLATKMWASVFWRERAMEESELT